MTSFLLSCARRPASLEVFAVLFLVGHLIGCGEPVIATVGTVKASQSDVDPDGDGDFRPDDDLEGGAAWSDARVERPDSGADAAVQYDAGPLQTDECYRLYDQSAEAGRAASTGLIAGSTVQASGCQLADMNDKVTSSIFWRKDGKPLLLGGESYSFRWPNTLGLLTKIRLFGGDEKCSVEKFLEVLPPMFAPYVAAPGCGEFKAELDVGYLRLSQDSWNLNAGVPMELCKAPCPPPP